MSCFGIERRWKNYFHFISGSELSASVEEKKNLNVFLSLPRFGLPFAHKNGQKGKRAFGKIGSLSK
jgi:hypothetical protein